MEVLQNVARLLTAKREQGIKGKKQSLRSLVKQRGRLTNIELKAQKIREFDRVAKRFHVGYSAMSGEKNADGTQNYIIFFCADDVERIDLALKKYASQKFKPSIQTKIEEAKAAAEIQRLTRIMHPKERVKDLEK